MKERKIMETNDLTIMNIEWKLKIEHEDKPTDRWNEKLMNVKSVEDLYNKTGWGFFDL